MKWNEAKTAVWVMALIGAGEGLLLGRGVELCFGMDQYRLIMLFGVLAGIGSGLMIWVGRGALMSDIRDARRIVVAGCLPSLTMFGIYFFWRILPLIQEEIRYSR